MKFVEIGINEEVLYLAGLYISNEILPKKSIADSLHIALCIINKIEILLSWNYKHLANINKKKQINILNMKENCLNIIEIITPYEVINEEV